MGRRFGRRSLLGAVGAGLLATGGCVQLFDGVQRCDEVTVTAARQVREGGVAARRSTIEVEVEIDADQSYTLSGYIATDDGRIEVSEPIPPSQREQTFTFGPYENVAHFGFHIEECP